MPARPRRRTLHLVATAAVLAAVVAGCGGTADEPTVRASTAAEETTAPPVEEAATATAPPAEDPTSDGSAAAAAPDGATVVEVTVAGGSVTTAASRVDVAVGTPVRLVVTSDADDELHVHGVDVEAPLAAGQPAVLDFVPAEPGLYDVETHDSALMLVQIAAR